MAETGTMLLARNPAVEEAPLQKELMLFSPATGQFYVLNSSMAYLWKQCDGVSPLDGVVERAVREFSEADPDRVREEFGVAAAQLRELGLLVDSGR